MTPFIMVFPELYICEPAGCTLNAYQSTLMSLEYVLDVLFLIEIFANFFKRTHINKTLKDIALHYVLGYFIFDLVAIIPIFLSEQHRFFSFKFLRLVHIKRVTEPVLKVLNLFVVNYSNKRKEDLVAFVTLIFNVIFLCHVLSCIWIALGKNGCKDDAGNVIAGCA
jgi:hypothetical protein